MSVTFAKQDKSTNSKEEQENRKFSPMLVTFDKEDMLEIVFKDEHSYKKPFLMSVTFAKQDKSTNSKEEQENRKSSPMLERTFIQETILDIGYLLKTRQINRLQRRAFP
eukprot:TRINITY_DN579_c0_g1_i13.p1 TRINITY_DN579_c0_g1~~TRINITY_DN579_c0_g1_i13.p1  ORF type:complete len:109 (-),score=25.90 TRINITY_DN579_c0_g1_i13:62-388(-)